MKRNKKIYLALVLFSFYGYGQEDQTPKVVPPYPVSADLGNYGNIPVGLHTGTPNINLDIYTLTEAGIMIPVTASYNSSGVQIDGLPRQLGIDWNLMVGGVVSRQVNDEDDLKKEFYEVPDTWLCLPGAPEAVLVGGSSVDTQKDIFNYSAPGISGKFFFNGSQIKEINPSGNRIELLHTPGPNNSVYRTFKITDIQGTEYYFGGESAVEVSHIIGHCGTSSVPISRYDTAWYLTKIKNIGGQEAIFKYRTDSFRYNQYNQTARLTSTAGLVTGLPIVGLPCYSTAYSTTVSVTEIAINDKKIKFDYSSLISGAEESIQLNHMGIYRDTDILFKSFDFSYYPILANKRIFLKNIVENGTESFDKYAFDYYSYAALPARYSYSKDIYGYFNNATNQNLIYNNLKFTHPLYEHFKNIGADRKPNPGYVHFGMLKSITYPTKGTTELSYEPNSTYLPTTIYPDPVVVSAGSEATGSATTIDSYVFNVPFQQPVVLYGEAELILSPVGSGLCVEGNYPTHWTPFSQVDIINTDNGQVAGSLNSQYDSNLTLSLPAGSYKLRVKSIRPCLNTFGSISYHTERPYSIMENKPAGGVRIQKTADNDLNGNLTVKKYYYADFDCLSCSSGQFSTVNPEDKPNLDYTVTDNPTAGITSTATLTSGAKHPLASESGSTIIYPTVIEGFGENFENGGVIHSYRTAFSEEGMTLCGEYVRGTPYNNTFSGEEIITAHFRRIGNSIITLKSDEYTYAHDASLDYSVKNYTAASAGQVIAAPGTGQFSSYIFTSYELRSQRHYLSSKKSTIFDTNGGNPIETLENYQYDAQHFQLTSTSSMNSAGESTERKLYYPEDLISDPYMDQLVAENRVGNPVASEYYKNNIRISSQKTAYHRGLSTRNLLLPLAVYGAKFPNYNPPIAGIGNLEKKITYDRYDAKGNILQYTLENGMPIAFLWGYDSSQPIAKIENATFSQVLAALSLTETVAGQLLEAPQVLRSLLPNAMITTYTYKPLVGVTSITDPKGMKTTYEYDTFGRLKAVYDNEGNLLSENEYKYRQN